MPITEVSQKLSTGEFSEPIPIGAKAENVTMADGTSAQSAITNKIDKSAIKDNLTSTSASEVLSANQGRILNAAIENKMNANATIDNLTSTSTTAPLSANQGRVLNNNKIETSAITNNLTTASTTTGKVLDARQGKVLNDAIALKVNTSSIVDNLTSQVTNVPLSANQGRVLKGLIDNKIDMSKIANNLTTSTAGRVLDASQGYVLNQNKVNTSAIANNLTTTAAGYVLDARQGQALSSRIGTLSSLNTTNKSNLVNSINEVNSNLANKVNRTNDSLIFNIGNYGSVEAQFRKVGVSNSEGLSIVTTNGSTVLYNGLINNDGTPIFLRRAEKTTTAVGSTVKPVYFNSSGVAQQCSSKQIISVQTITVQTSTAIAAGKSEQVSATFNAVAGATTYLPVIYQNDYGCGISKISISGTTLKATLMSIYATHTLLVKFHIFALA